MKLFNRLSKKNIVLFLTVLGPGIITANLDNDAGGITIYSLAGAHFGYSLLWALVPMLICLVMVQEMSARMGVVTGKGLASLIRENFGIKGTFYLMFALLITNLGNTAAEFAGLAASFEIFGLNRYIVVPVGGLLIWLMVIMGTRRIVERILLVACFIFFTYIVSAFMAGPDWKEIGHNILIPKIQFDHSYMLMLVALIGTTITPWMQFYIQAAIVEKEIKISEYKWTRLDIILGCIIMNIVTLFIIVACASTIFKTGGRIEDAKDAAIALTPFAGRHATLLFAIGLANASLFSASILPLATAYYICEGMGWETGIDKKFHEAPQFMWIYTILIILGGLIILIPSIPLIHVMALSQVANGLLLPFVLIFMLKMINDKTLMGEYTNSKTYNSIVGVFSLGLIVLSVLLVWHTVV